MRCRRRSPLTRDSLYLARDSEYLVTALSKNMWVTQLSCLIYVTEAMLAFDGRASRSPQAG